MTTNNYREWPCEFASADALIVWPRSSGGADFIISEDGHLREQMLVELSRSSIEGIRDYLTEILKEGGD